ncbi:DUF1015 family protein [Streptacidiphilus sp. MAP12-20]|uniref:DUF1015 family protein n=1 Tax=Streptacidiphilus sp. MAP12-20 TaxID=3156299 RepID=UPI003514EE79
MRAVSADDASETRYGDAGRVAACGLSLNPFRGLRYDPERVSSLAAVTSPPYDVVDPDGRVRLEDSDPHNVVRLILPRPEPTAEDGYRHAARLLGDWQRTGILAADPVPALYVYEQQTSPEDGGLLQRGLIGALAVSDARAGMVLPHEDVMPRPVADRVGLMRTTKANLEPLLLTYRGDGRAAGVVEDAAARDPLIETTTSDGTRHRLWAVTAHEELAAVSADLATCRALIADGHHRWAMYLRLQREHRHLAQSPWDRGMVLLVDTAQYPLRVRAIHRVLQRLPVAEALARLDASGSDAWSVTDLGDRQGDALTALAAAKAAGTGAFLLAGDGRYRLVAGPDEKTLDATVPLNLPEEYRRLDATVLHSVLLDHVWRVPDDPEHIGYLHDTDAAVREAARLGGTAVLLHPVEEGVVRRLAEQGVTMPRKSTSFGPKPATGLVLRNLRLD